MDNMGQNKQSAEQAYKEIEQIKSTNNDLKEQLNKAQTQLESLEKMQSESNLAIENESLRRQLDQAMETIKGYQDLNQKLFLKVAKPVDEKPQINEEEVARKQELDDIEAKIAAHNKEIEEFNKQEM